MENTILSVIRSKRYDLEKIIERIRYYHASGDLTDVQCANLIQTARENAIETLGVDAKTEIFALWEAVHELQRRLDDLTPAAGQEEDGQEEPVIPDYVQPTGAHNAYNTGDLVRFNEEVYECVIDNCVWSPEVYPAGWRKQ